MKQSIPLPNAQRSIVDTGNVEELPDNVLNEKFKYPKGKVKNSVGAGDSMVAGFVAGYMKSHDYRVALNMGTAAGSATAFSDDLATGELINSIYETL